MEIAITGIGSVSAAGPLQGPAGERESRPQAIRSWPTKGVRKAFLVEGFRPSDFAPGIRTRRLDRLSVWALVTAAIALRDARIELAASDGSRYAVVFGSGFGCLSTTEDYLRTVAGCGWDHADPILFPDSLSNSAASHVARHLAITGPNVTVSSRGISGEAALIQAASLLKSGEVERAIVIAGDTLTRPLYEWYEAAGVLSSGLIPGEGAAAVIMETGRQYLERGASAYVQYCRGALGADTTATAATYGRSAAATARVIRKTLGEGKPQEIGAIISAANGCPELDSIEEQAIREALDARQAARLVAPKRCFGEFEGSGVLRLAAGLVEARGHGPTLLLGASAGGGRAALLFNA